MNTVNGKKDTKHKKNHDNKQQTNHHKMMIRDFRIRFIVSLILTIPIIILSPTIQNWLNYSLTFPYVEYVILVIATAIFVYGGWPFFKGTIKEFKKKMPGMMTLIALAISVAFI